MDIGLYIFPTDYTIGPVEMAKLAEAKGFASLWFPEHSHIPASRVTPWGGHEEAPPLPQEYCQLYDQFVALAAASSVTSTLRLGTGITLVAQRDPIWLAKQVASLDALSNGRLDFGIGYGWNKEEMAHHGTAYLERRAILRENVLAMKELWTKNEAEFHGEHVNFSPSWSWPKPSQKPHPPISIGGAGGPKTYADIIEFCDIWMPISPLAEVFAEKTTILRQMATDAGRDPASIGLSVFKARPDESILTAYAELGVQQALFTINPSPPDQVAEQVGTLAEFVGQYS
jgi:probable F420-dependent oxidoreductase